MPKKHEPDLIYFGKRAGALASLLGVSALALSVGPCSADWKFITSVEAKKAHGKIDARAQNLKEDLARIEGKIDTLTELNKDFLKGIDNE